MIVNFMAREINRGTHKLIRTLTLIIIIKKSTLLAQSHCSNNSYNTCILGRENLFFFKKNNIKTMLF